MRNIKLSWLGPPIVERENSTLHLETRKATALLAFLGLSTIPTSRESLAALFWPEFDQSHAHANLRRTLFSINQTTYALGKIVNYFLENPNAWNDTKRITNGSPTKIIVKDGLEGLVFKLTDLTQGDDVALVFIETKK